MRRLIIMRRLDVPEHGEFCMPAKRSAAKKLHAGQSLKTARSSNGSANKKVPSGNIKLFRNGVLSRNFLDAAIDHENG